MVFTTKKTRCFYDLAMYKPWKRIFQYPLMVLFLIDFHLTWKMTDAELKGDVATNISSISGILLTTIGRVLECIRNTGRCRMKK